MNESFRASEGLETYVVRLGSFENLAKLCVFAFLNLGSDISTTSTVFGSRFANTGASLL